VQHILKLVPVKELKPMKVLADTANGMVGPSLAALFKHIPQIELVPMYFEPDGNFPNHGGDPLMPENRQELEERVAKGEGELGFAFDPDGDRFFCIDRTGRFVAGDYLTTILSEYFLDRNPGSTIVYDIRSSHAVRDRVAAKGGKSVYNRVGHAYIKARMMNENAVFGGEVTGHYYFRDFFFCDSGVAPMMFLLHALSKSDRTLDKIVDELSKVYYISGEINTKGVDSKEVLTKLEEKYGASAKECLKIDGLTCEFDGWHFNVRGSNTEPLVRLNLEATNEQLMEQKRDELLGLIRSLVR
jgi:phosphomannomutase